MPTADPIPPLLGALRALETWLRSERLPHVYIGGLAVALVGRPRITRDIDAIVLLGDMTIDDFARKARSSGFSTRVRGAAAFARRTRVVLLRHVATRVEIDLSLGSLPFEEEAVRRARRMRVKGLTVPVARAEDLVVLKSIAARPRDLIDIEGVLLTNPSLDRTGVRSQTKLFADLLEAPELLEGLDRLLRETPGRRTPSARGRRPRT